MFKNWKLCTYALAISLAIYADNVSASTLSPDTWRQAVNQNAAILRSGDYSGALKTSDRILAQMVEHLGAGGAENDILATTLTQKALASAGNLSVRVTPRSEKAQKFENSPSAARRQPKTSALWLHPVSM